VRIIAGEWRRRLLRAPPAKATRPDRRPHPRDAVRDAREPAGRCFEGLAVGDLFAGSGALGLEALVARRGDCLFVENDPASDPRLARRTSPRCARSRNAKCAPGSVMQLGPAKQPLDLILLDPPYQTGAGQVALDRLARLGWIGAGTWIALETAHGEKVQVKALAIESERKVGKAQLTLLRLAA
jgi:16S rRNA (guanine966-N2)-methyltransferase